MPDDTKGKLITSREYRPRNGRSPYDRPGIDPADKGKAQPNSALSGALTSAQQAEIEDLAALSANFATKAFGQGTLANYRSAWKLYTTWCYGLGLDPFGGNSGPVPLYAAHLAKSGRALSTIRMALAAIGTAYRLSGHALDIHDPRLAPLLKGISRTIGSRPRKKARPAVPNILRLMLNQCGTNEIFKAGIAARDRAMLLIGFGAALRRSELVNLSIEDVEIIPDRGILLHITHSKTDQAGQGQYIAISSNPAEPDFCPEKALEKWMAFRTRAEDCQKNVEKTLEHGREQRPLFCAISPGKVITGRRLNDEVVIRLVKTKVSQAGLDPKMYSGHSLRSGFMTAAGEAGTELAAIMRQSRHVSPQIALGYIRPSDLWKNNASVKVFKGD